MKETIINILNGVFLFIVMLFFLDSFSSFQIKSQLLKSIVYFGVIISPLILLVLNIFLIKNTSKRVILSIISFAILVGVFVYNPMRILATSISWKTQTILYKKKTSATRRIEFQMGGFSALGYKERNVEVQYFTPLFMFVKDVDLNKIDSKIYEQVNIDVDELELKKRWAH
ncbi:MAG: hypothetical protein EOP53_23170 [Sphingobacteriales bacterium]|nr:MAG: hypothetical protein EOP53_23170 [Sphingobacteriales bacterium]